ncbi:MAG: hypothetical protein ACOYLP_11145 [Flavobacterium sp.]|jgi:hypothetical protein|uniref:hypothetical protein n=1 Tax=Flavobacterium sp. TaxID=239 RepID=UPI003BCBF9B6
MDKDSFYIFSVLSDSEKPITTAEISKEIYKKFNVRLSKKICQNYLWSFFRNNIIFDQDNYTYLLDYNNQIDFDIEVRQSINLPRAISSKVIDSKLVVEYDMNVPFDIFVKAIAYLNFSKTTSNSKKDLFKEINQRIESLNDH